MSCLGAAEPLALSLSRALGAWDLGGGLWGGARLAGGGRACPVSVSEEGRALGIAVLIGVSALHLCGWIVAWPIIVLVCIGGSLHPY